MESIELFFHNDLSIPEPFLSHSHPFLNSTSFLSHYSLVIPNCGQTTAIFEISDVERLFLAIGLHNIEAFRRSGPKTRLNQLPVINF